MMEMDLRLSDHCVKCPICAHASFHQAADVVCLPANVRRLKHEKYTLWRCDSCGSIHVKEGIDFVNCYKDYPLQNQRLDIALKAGFYKRWLTLKRRGLLREHKILDYGSGSSFFVEFLRVKGYDVEGYDPYHHEVAIRSTLDRRYDWILAQDVIEHDDDPAGFLKTLRRLLSPDGKIVIGTPCADGIKLKHRHLMWLHPPFHRHILSKQALFQLVERENFEMEFVDDWYLNTPFPFANSAFFEQYINLCGNLIDVVTEPPQIMRVLRSPRALFLGLFGFYLRDRLNMTAVLAVRRNHNSHRQKTSKHEMLDQITNEGSVPQRSTDVAQEGGMGANFSNHINKPLPRITCSKYLQFTPNNTPHRSNRSKD